MADQSQQGLAQLPAFNDAKIYLVTGKSLNSIIAAIKANRVKVVQGGGLKQVSQSDQGTFLAVANTIDLTVCVNGTAVTKKFCLAE